MPASLNGGTVFFKVKYLFYPLFYISPVRNLFQITVGDDILFGHPILRFRALVIFQPTVGIADFLGKILIGNGRVFAAKWIGHRDFFETHGRCSGRRVAGASDNRNDRQEEEQQFHE